MRSNPIDWRTEDPRPYEQGYVCRRCRAGIGRRLPNQPYRVFCDGDERHEITDLADLLHRATLDRIAAVERSDAQFFKQVCRELGIEVDEVVLPGELRDGSHLLYGAPDFEGFD